MSKCLQRLLVLILVVLPPGYVSFAGEGTVIATEDDVLRFDITGGIASPAPGMAVGGSVLWTKYARDAFGVALGWSRHELVSEDSKLSNGYLDFAWERSTPLLGGYHAVRLRGVIGLARMHRGMDKNVARQKSEDPTVTAWGLHAGSSLSFDVPVADLVWGRLSFDLQKTMTPKSPTQLSLTAGVVWGGQWFGVGD